MTARDHHYLFSHVLLRNTVLRQPERFLANVRGPLGEGFLFHLWQEVEAVAAEKVSAVGLYVAGVDAIGGGTLALVQLPAPERDTESLFAAAFVGPAGTRYFVFDRSVGDPSHATLAELELDDTRVSFGRFAATREALLDALERELGASSAPSSSPPPPVSVGGVVSAPPPPMHSSLAPGAYPASTAQPRKANRGVLIAGLSLVLGAPLLCCLGTAIMGYDGGLDDDATFPLTTELTYDEADNEVLELSLEGDAEGWSHWSVRGPGAESCSYLSRWSTCRVALASVQEARPSYHVTGNGEVSRWFGMALGSRRVEEQTIPIERPLGLRYSAALGATVVRGFPGRLEVTPEGALRLVDAPPGTTLRIGAQPGGTMPAPTTPPSTEAPLDLAALVAQVGIAAIYQEQQPTPPRASVANVTVRLVDGTTAAGSAEVRAPDLARALTSRLSALGDANLGPATGVGAIWIENGRFRELVGAPRTLADVGRVVITDAVETRAGSCGPYSTWGVGGSYLPRMRWTTTVEAYDRAADRRIALRRFTARTPRCPQWIDGGTQAIREARDASSADEYAREQLAVPAAE
ncbi:MAG: hypothetical protein AB7S26_01910 [Sandaracinaceae bacterium]